MNTTNLSEPSLAIVPYFNFNQTLANSIKKSLETIVSEGKDPLDDTINSIVNNSIFNQMQKYRNSAYQLSEIFDDSTWSVPLTSIEKEILLPQLKNLEEERLIEMQTLFPTITPEERLCFSQAMFPFMKKQKILSIYTMYGLVYNESIKKLLSSSKTTRLYIHNTRLFFMLGFDELNKWAFQGIKVKEISFSELIGNQIQKAIELIEKYNENPDDLKEILIKNHPENKKKIEEDFKHLEHLRKWVEREALPEITCNQEKITQETIEHIKNAEDIFFKIEDSTNPDLMGAKRIKFEVENTPRNFGASILFFYAQGPKKGEKHEREVLNDLAKTFLDKLPWNSISADKNTVLDALIHGKIYTFSILHTCFSHFMSAWFPKKDSKYPVVPFKEGRSLTFWLYGDV